MTYKEELYCEKVEDVVTIINEYINLYDYFYSKYEQSIECFMKDFIEKFMSEDFEVIKKYSIYDLQYKSKEIVLAIKDNLEVKLDVHGIGSSKEDNCTYKIENGFKYTRIITSVNAYKIDILIGNSNTFKKIRSINDLEDLKISILNNRYTLEEVRIIIESLSANKSESLEIEINKLENIFFILIEKNKSEIIKKFKFDNIEQLYNYLEKGSYLVI